MSVNIASPNTILNPISSKDIKKWFEKEINNLEPKSLRKIYLNVFKNIEDFYCFPKNATLLMKGCDRTSEKGKRKYHRYPESIKLMAKTKKIYLDGRPNGPAVASFEMSGGIRPKRYGSRNKWSIHHLYSGKFPYTQKTLTTHASKDGLHFTQSAGLVAVHPLLDALCDESPAFTWLLRYQSWKKFGYDPDCVFSKKIDHYGFDISKTLNKGNLV